MVKKIEVYESEDGSLFRSLVEAIDHEQSMNFVNFITDLVNNNWYNGMKKQDIISFIIEHESEIKKKLLITQSVYKNSKTEIDTFIAYNCTIEEEKKVSIDRIYCKYKIWCKENSLLCLSKNTLVKCIAKKFKITNGFFYGIDLKEY